MIKTSFVRNIGLFRGISGLTAAIAGLGTASAQSTAFTYQGRLNWNGQPANGLYDLSFSVMDAAVGGAAINGSQVTNGVPVTNGLFTVTINPGAGVFTGAPRWLSIVAKTNGASVYQQISPRQPITATPYAVRASEAATAQEVNGRIRATEFQLGTSAAAGSILTANASGSGTWQTPAFVAKAGDTMTGDLVIASPADLNFGSTTRQMLNLYNASYGIGVQANTLYQRSDSDFAWHRWGSHANNAQDPGAGGTNLMLLDGNGELFINASLTLDRPGANNGTLRPGLLFGAGSGEGIASARAAGSMNRYGLDFYTAFQKRLSIQNNGRVGIGTSQPEYDFDLVGSAAVRNSLFLNTKGVQDPVYPELPALVFGDLNSGEVISSQRGTNGVNRYGLDFYTGFQKRVSIANNGRVDVNTGAGTIEFRNESGAVPGINIANSPNPGVMRFRNAMEIWPDDTGARSGRLDVRDTSGNATIILNGQSGEATVKILSITGGADIAEPFQIAESEVAKGSVVVIDDEHPGRLKLSDRAYDTRVAGIVSGANGVNPGLALHQEGLIEGGHHVALTGRVYALADASSTPIKPGDLLTTSDAAGHVMKVTDRERGSGAILGKAMTGLKEGKGLVLVLVSLQ